MLGDALDRVLYFIGDSHVMTPFAGVEAGLFKPYACRVEQVGGATAVGLRHPFSQTQALPIFQERLTPLDPQVTPVFQLGEVDCGFVIWVRAQRHGESVLEQLDASLEAYQGFLLWARNFGYRDVVVSSATLPTIRDGQLEGEVSHLRHEVKASQRDRTDLTLEYNLRLGAFCAAAGFRFADLTPHLLDPSTQLLAERFRHPNPLDHHLNPDEAAPVWASVVLEALRG